MEKPKKNNLIELFYNEDRPGVYYIDEEDQKISVDVVSYGRTIVFPNDKVPIPLYTSIPFGKKEVKLLVNNIFGNNQIMPNAYARSGPYWSAYGQGDHFVNFFLLQK